GFRGPVILLEADDGGVRVVPLKIEDIADIGTAEGIDALGVVADDANIPVLLSEEFYEYILGPVGVLILVDKDKPEAVLVFGQDLFLTLEELDRLQEKVVEVHGVIRLQALLVFGVDPCRLLFKNVEGLGGRFLRPYQLGLR